MNERPQDVPPIPPGEPPGEPPLGDDDDTDSPPVELPNVDDPE
jgi:hypothetical protein